MNDFVHFYFIYYFLDFLILKGAQYVEPFFSCFYNLQLQEDLHGVIDQSEATKAALFHIEPKKNTIENGNTKHTLNVMLKL